MGGSDVVKVVVTAPPWSHTHAIGAATTDADVLGATGAVANDDDVLKATGAVANVTPISAGTLTGACGAVGCDSDHPNGCANVANVVQASGVGKATGTVRAAGASKKTVVTAIPSVTGAPQ